MTADHCKCGHNEVLHQPPGQCLGLRAGSGSIPDRLCFCTAFTPPAREVPDLQAGIERVLAEHRFRRHSGVQQRDGSYRKQPVGCECWHWEGDESAHRDHVAARVVEYIRQEGTGE